MTRPIIILKTSRGKRQVQLNRLVLGEYDTLDQAKDSILDRKGASVETRSGEDLLQEYVV